MEEIFLCCFTTLSSSSSISQNVCCIKYHNEHLLSTQSGLTIGDGSKFPEKSFPGSKTFVLQTQIVLL